MSWTSTIREEGIKIEEFGRLRLYQVYQPSVPTCWMTEEEQIDYAIRKSEQDVQYSPPTMISLASANGYAGMV